MSIVIESSKTLTIPIPPSFIKETIELREGASADIIIEGSRKLELEAYLKEPGASLRIFGIFHGREQDEQHVVLRVFQDAPQTVCSVYFRSALSGSSSSLFDGMIRMGENAVGARGYLSYRALLLSDKARAKPIPRLEVLTKRVASSGHEAAVGKINEEQLFYMESRGLKKEEAERLIVEGFLRIPG